MVFECFKMKCQKVIIEHPARCRLGFVVLVMAHFGDSLFCRFCRGPSTEFLSLLPVSDKLKRTLLGAGSPAMPGEEITMRNVARQ